MSDAARWWVFVAAWYARRLWRDLPGPWWLKVGLVVACVAIPGPFDELALIALPRVCGMVRRWLAARRQF